MFKSVERHLLSDSGLDITKLESALATIHCHDTDYADLYFQSSQHESWVLEDGIIKEGSYNIERGVGVRAISGEKTGFAYSDEISEEALTKACKAARGIAPSGGKQQVAGLGHKPVEARYAENNPILAMQDAEKISLLKAVDAYIRKQEPSANQVVVSLSGVYEEILVAGSDGTLATDIRPLVRLNCSVLLE
ncbi:MAG: DNA gyrase modulator, partial [Pseudomonadota bacterium]|nr:DNA gyrase modulator [Pseudomonadota bacterium]